MVEFRTLGLVPQTWIAQILHEIGEETKNDDDLDSSSDVLLDGRVLCQVVNAIAPGTVEVIHQDKSKKVQKSLIFNVVVAYHCWTVRQQLAVPI